jgi:hypothetical protein
VAAIRNKFSHTLTLFFLCTYIDQWTTFFTDIFALIHFADTSLPRAYNRHVSLLFFHVVLEISGEVADQMIKSARTFSQTRHARDARVRDSVRERDAAGINEAVLTIVADGAGKMAALRKAEAFTETTRELEGVIEVVDWGVRTFGSYVGKLRSIHSLRHFDSYALPIRMDRHQSYRNPKYDPITLHAIIRPILADPAGDLPIPATYRVQRPQRAW